MTRRILLLVTDLEIGGTPTVVRELARRLRQPGKVHIEVACLAQWGPVASRIKEDGVHVTALGARGMWDLRVLHRLNHLMRARGCDTCFSFLVHANALAAASSRFLRDVRYMQSIQTAQLWPRWHWQVQRLAHHAAKMVVVPSGSVSRAAQAWARVPPEKIVVIPNAVDAAELQGCAGDFAGQRPYPIGFLGRLDPVKRIPDLLLAVQKLSGLVHLHIFGEGVERARIEAEIDRLGLEEMVTMHGAVTTPCQALRQIGLLVLPSAAEGFGLVLIEAMAAGVPVVATNVAGIRDVVKDGETGLLVPPATPAALAEAISRVINDSALRENLIARAAVDVRQGFSWEAVLPLYRRLLAID